MFCLFLEINSDLDLNNLLSKASGVRMKKKIIVSKIFGTILLNIYEILNQIFSIMIEALLKKTPNPERTKHK